MSNTNILFFSVARVSDQNILSSFSFQNKNDENTSLIMTRRVLSAPSWKDQVYPNEQHSLDADHTKV